MRCRHSKNLLIIFTIKFKIIIPSELEPVERAFKPIMKAPFNKFSQSVLGPMLRSHNIDLAHGSNNTIRSQLHKTRPRQEGGVYIVPCKECDECYVGQTGRELSVRIQEHKSYIVKRQTEKAVFKHIRDKNHSVDFDKARYVFESGDIKQRLVVESALIQELPNFNLCEGASSITTASKDIILRCNKRIMDRVREFPT